METKRKFKEFLRNRLSSNRLFLLINKTSRRVFSMFNKHKMEVSAESPVADEIYVTQGTGSIMIVATTLAYIERLDRVTVAFSFTKEHYLVDKTIDALASELDEQQFFQLHRACIINRDLVKGYRKASSNRLLLITSFVDINFFVSQRRVADFKRWWAKL